MTVEEANKQLDAALVVRLDAHARKRLGNDHTTGGMSVHEYLEALRWVRAVEDELEPIRREAGHTFSRAWESWKARTGQ